MQITAALRERAPLAAFRPQVDHAAANKGSAVGMERRTHRTGRQLILGALVAPSLRVLALGRVVAPRRRAHSVKAVAQGLAYFLKDAGVPAATVSTGWLEEAARQLDPATVRTYRGHALVVLDPTEYAKRSRGRGKCGRQMEHIGRVRRSKFPAKRKKGAGTPGLERAPPVVTTYGYVGIWAGVVLRGKRFFPLARQLFSRQHPQLQFQEILSRRQTGPLGPH